MYVMKDEPAFIDVEGWLKRYMITKAVDVGYADEGYTAWVASVYQFVDDREEEIYEEIKRLVKNDEDYENPFAQYRLNVLTNNGKELFKSILIGREIQFRD